MPTRYSAEEALQKILQLQNLDSDNSGDSDSDVDDEVVDHEEDDAVEDDCVGDVGDDDSADNSHSSETDDDSDMCLQPLRKRIKVADSHPIVARKGGGRSGRGRTHIACQQDSESEEESKVEEVVGLAAGKDDSVWTSLDGNELAGKQTAQNVVHHVPGPTREARQRISTIFDAFKCILDVTMVSWLTNCTEIEARK